MRLTILGAGPVGLASAALAGARGHGVTLWSPRGGGTRGIRDAVLANAPAPEHGFFGVPKVIE